MNTLTAAFLCVAASLGLAALLRRVERERARRMRSKALFEAALFAAGERRRQQDEVGPTLGFGTLIRDCASRDFVWIIRATDDDQAWRTIDVIARDLSHREAA